MVLFFWSLPLPFLSEFSVTSIVTTLSSKLVDNFFNIVKNFFTSGYYSDTEDFLSWYLMRTYLRTFQGRGHYNFFSVSLSFRGEIQFWGSWSVIVSRVNFILRGFSRMISSTFRCNILTKEENFLFRGPEDLPNRMCTILCITYVC